MKSDSLSSPSVRMERLGSHRTDCHKIWCLRIFRKSVEKTQTSLKSDENIGYFISVFLNRRAAARYRALASIIPGRKRFSWNLSF